MGKKKAPRPHILLRDLRKAIRGAGPGVRVQVEYVDADGYLHKGYASVVGLGTDIFGHVQLELGVYEDE